MPTVSVTLNNITQSVMRPMAIDIIQQLMGVTKISSDTKIYYGNERGQLAAAGSLHGQEADRRAVFEGNRRVIVEVDETYSEDMNSTDTVGRRDNNYILADTDCGLYIWPVFTTSSVVIRFAFETKSKEEARRWMDDVNMRYKQSRISPEHHLTYGYTLPQPAWSLVEAVYNARENKDGYGQRFGEYLNSVMTSRLTVIGNENGTHRQFAVSERRRRVQGNFNFTVANVPKPEFDESMQVWRISFEYSFTYQRPQGLDMKYPIIVHNQILPEKFVEFVNHEPKTEPRIHYNMSQTAWANRQFESNVLAHYLSPHGSYLRIPAEDDFLIQGTFPGTGTFLLVLLAMADPEDKVFNLNELGEDVMIDQDILDFLKSEYAYIGIPGKSIFHAEVYRNEMPLAFPSVKIDKDLNVTLITTPSMRMQYRVRFSLFTDFDRIERQALDRLRIYPKAFVKVIGSINELLFKQADFQKLGDQRVIQPWQLSRAWEVITGRTIAGTHMGNMTSVRVPMGGKDFAAQIPPWLAKRHRDSKGTTMTVMGLNIFATKK